MFSVTRQGASYSECRVYLTKDEGNVEVLSIEYPEDQLIFGA